MSGRKLSGHEGRKRKAAHAEEDKQQGAALFQFLKRPASTNITSPDSTVAEDKLGPHPASSGKDGGGGKGDGGDECNREDAEVLEQESSPACKPGGDGDSGDGGGKAKTGADCLLEENLPSASGQGGDEANGSGVASVQYDIDVPVHSALSDPAKWLPARDSPYVDSIVRVGPAPMEDRYFPRDEQKRHFSKLHYYRETANGDKVLRRWLVYSASADKVFCFCCKLFDRMSKSSLASDGYGNWKHVGTVLSSHETSSAHFSSFATWTKTELRLRGELEGVDTLHQRRMIAEIEHWQGVLERQVAITMFLAQGNIAFRGSSDKLFTPNNGNYLKLNELLGKFDPLMKEHLRRLIGKEISDHYCSKTIQNELIDLIAKKTVDEILVNLKEAKYFSIILDCTPDVNRKKQMTFIVRFVEKTDGILKPAEHFLGFKVAEKTTGEALLALVVSTFSEMDLDLKNARGQGYDNGANMSGVRKGLQARLSELFPRAKYVPCGCHSLNLLLCDVAKHCYVCITLFGVIQKIYVLFSSSPGRWQILVDAIDNFTLKPLCETRWESRIESLKPFRYDLKGVFEALTTLERCSNFDAAVCYDAKCLANKICELEFLVSLVVWYDVLYEVNVASKALQAEDVDISMAETLIKGCIKYLDRYQTHGFEEAVAAAKELSISVQKDCPDFKVARRRRLPRRYAEDEDRSEDFETDEDEGDGSNPGNLSAQASAQQDFKSKFFDRLVATASESLNERFKYLREHGNSWGFLHDLTTLRDPDELERLCKNLERELTDGDQRDINGEELCLEIKHLQPLLPNGAKSPRQVLQFLHDAKTVDCFPNVEVALRILLTIPVSVACGERSFSVLKLTETYLRSTTSQDRLSSLAIISIEREVANAIDFKELLKDFAVIKARKAPFM